MRILTFDIEDWFHILDNHETCSPASWDNFPSRIDFGVERILGLLRENNQAATFFCLGWIAERYPHIVRKIHSAGYQIASHSFNHQLAYDQTRKEFEDDLRRSIDTLQQITGTVVDTYRAPGFSVTEKNTWVFESLVNQGIRVDCSVFPAERAHGGLSKFRVAVPSVVVFGSSEVLELPINTVSFIGKKLIYSGGGYFRILPRWYLNHRFLRDQYIMTYFHPRDFDPFQPVVPGLSRFRRFKSYVGLKKTYNKLEYILQKKHFIDVAQAVDSIDPTKINRITLG